MPSRRVVSQGIALNFYVEESAMADTRKKVKDTIDMTADKAKEATDKTVDKSKEIARSAGQKTKEAGEKIKEMGK